ncbi:MAG: hypothetical protein IMZ50_10450 [Candidatus Atribacteria bacterium]|nr:hypothetical protein [Candidatus Atribacteria bacterium]
MTIWRRLSARPTCRLRRVPLNPDFWKEQAPSVDYFRSGKRTFGVWHTGDPGADFNAKDGDPKRRAAMKKAFAKFDIWYERIEEPCG